MPQVFSKASFTNRQIDNNMYICNIKKDTLYSDQIYNRVKPIDNINKDLLLSPRMLTTSNSNKYEYNKEVFLFPPKTEILIKKNKNLDEQLCHQNFVNIDDESFLFNINTKATKFKDANIKQSIAMINPITPFDDVSLNWTGMPYRANTANNTNMVNNTKFIINEHTKRNHLKKR